MTRMEGVDSAVVKLANLRAYLSTCVMLSRLVFSRQALCWWLFSQSTASIDGLIIKVYAICPASSIR
jgi:hypothetical protein